MNKSVTASLKNSGMRWFGAAGALAAGLVLANQAWAHDGHDNQVSITIEGDQRCIVSNGLPDHDTGAFPNQGNPNTISEQNVSLCVSANPVKQSRPAEVRGSIGVAVNGVQIRPATAEYFDGSSPRGISRDRSSGWNFEGLGNAAMLGMDGNIAHVDERGLYHYHGVGEGLAEAADGTLIGYAADGFEIHYVGDQQTSGYRLKSGSRPSGPGGTYDGAFVQDWEYVAGSGTLDACNGGTLDGEFVYFATDTYPFFPRCQWGEVSADFQQGPPRGMAQGPAGQGGLAAGGPGFPQQTARLQSPGFGPPPEAVEACYIWNAYVRHIGVNIEARGFDVSRIPKTGPMVFVANHPTGMVDGHLLGSVIEKNIRSDFKIMAVPHLSELPGLKDRVIPVYLPSPSGRAYPHAERLIAEARQAARQHVQSGASMLIFPCGPGASRSPEGAMLDGEWRYGAFSLAAKTGAKVVPVHIAAPVSPVRDWLQGVHPILFHAAAPQDVKYLKGKTVKVTFGDPDSAELKDALSDISTAPAKVGDLVYRLPGGH